MPVGVLIYWMIWGEFQKRFTRFESSWGLWEAAWLCRPIGVIYAITDYNQLLTLVFCTGYSIFVSKFHNFNLLLQCSHCFHILTKVCTSDYISCFARTIVMWGLAITCVPYPITRVPQESPMLTSLYWHQQSPSFPSYFSFALFPCLKWCFIFAKAKYPCIPSVFFFFFFWGGGGCAVVFFIFFYRHSLDYFHLIVYSQPGTLRYPNIIGWLVWLVGWIDDALPPLGGGGGGGGWLHLGSSNYFFCKYLNQMVCKMHIVALFSLGVTSVPSTLRYKTHLY